MLKALKKWLFGDPYVDEVCKGIVKDKKLSPEEKMNIILANYQKYFANQFHKDVNMATYEMHYEQFVDKNGQRNDYNYKLCYAEEKNNMAFCQVAMLSSFYKELVQQGLDKQQLSHQHNHIILMLEFFDKEFSKLNYDGTRFYADIQAQTNLLKITYRVINSLQDNQAETQSQDQTTQHDDSAQM